MLKPNRRTTPRHKSRPFSLNQPSKKSAQVHFDRLSSQFKKKLGRGNASEIVDTVTNEIGWVGLLALLLCFTVVIALIIYLTLSGTEGTPIRGDHRETIFNDIDEVNNHILPFPVYISWENNPDTNYKVPISDDTH